jgi:uncharacterized protein YndB with AHSA1/START domain
MAQISHLVRIEATPDEVFRRVATSDGIAAWLTRASSSDYRKGGTLELLFPDQRVRFTVTELIAPARIIWHCTTKENDWFDTDIAFEFVARGGRTLVRFDHSGWRGGYRPRPRLQHELGLFPGEPPVADRRRPRHTRSFP